jgi:hypothetical protein
MAGWWWNVVFRAMHDLEGHAATGFTIPWALTHEFPELLKRRKL